MATSSRPPRVAVPWPCAGCGSREWPAEARSAKARCYDGRPYGVRGRLCLACYQRLRRLGLPVRPCGLCGTGGGPSRPEQPGSRPVRYRVRVGDRDALVCGDCRAAERSREAVPLRRCDGCGTFGGHVRPGRSRPARMHGGRLGRRGEVFCHGCACALRAALRRAFERHKEAVLAEVRPLAALRAEAERRGGVRRKREAYTPKTCRVAGGGSG